MKRAFALVLLATLILSACAPGPAPTSTPATPVALLPTDTPALTATPTNTATPTATPTVTPTATPTPIPTLPPEQVGGLTGVPDPRYSNPELLDLSKPDAPIPQFVNAMQAAGLIISPEQVSQTLVYRQSHSKAGRPLIAFTVSGTKTEFDYTPLMIWSEDYGWQRVTLAEIARLKGFLVGTEGSGWLLGNRESLNLAQEQVQIVIPTYPTISWRTLQPTKNAFDAEQLRRFIRTWKSKGFRIIFPGILPGQAADLPDWLISNNYSTAELEEFIVSYVSAVVNAAVAEGVDTGIIISEPYLPKYRTNDYLYKKFGNSYRYIRIAVLAAKAASPDFKLVYNDTDNHAEAGLTTQLTRQILNENPEIDYVGIEGHLGDWVRFYSYSEIVSTLKSYARSLIVTENDISLHNMSGSISQKRLRQARAAYEFISAAKEAGTTTFIFWGLDENVSWLENALDQKDSYATMFDKNHQPMPYFYSVCKALLYDNR